MPKPEIKLAALLDLLESEHTDYTSLLDLETGEAVIMEARLVTAAARGDHKTLARVPEWQIPDAEMARVIAADAGGKRFIKGPDKIHFHECRHMERFIGTIENEDQAEQLWRAIESEEATRNFKDIADRLDLLDRWFSYRHGAMKEYVLKWAAENGLPAVE